IICSPMTSLKTSIKTITYLSDTGCLEIQGASLGFERATVPQERSFFLNMLTSYKEIQIKLLSACGSECTDRL
ncbi:hypothetical protein, partial [Escherichia coli]|uniref:hypothetical protein n=1 Tax=Escherichia coli TaxID=562 RepID=UPI0022483B80